MKINNINYIVALLFCIVASVGSSQTLLIPDRVFDGFQIQEGWAVLVNGNKISEVGPLK